MSDDRGKLLLNGAPPRADEGLANTDAARPGSSLPAPIVMFGPQTVRPAGSRQILVLKLDHIGDFTIGRPALEALRRAFADDYITLICGNWNVDAARASGLADSVRQYDFFPEHAQGWSGRPVQALSVFDTAAKGPFDIAIDLRVDGDTRHLLERVDAIVKCGIGSRQRFPFLDVILPTEYSQQDYFDVERLSAATIGPERFNSRLKRKGSLIHEGKVGGVRGHLIFGPYVQLPLGVYRVAFGVRAHGSYQWPAARLKVEVARENVVVASARLRAEDLSGESNDDPILQFENLDPGARYEFRVHKTGWSLGGRLQFSGVRLEQIGALPAAQNPKPELHIGEHLSLLVDLVKQRLLFEPPPNMETSGRRSPAEDAIARLPPGPRVILAPLSNSTLRDWPLDQYSRLVALLLEQTNCQIILVGAPAQTKSINQIIEENNKSYRILNLSGLTSRQDLPYVLRTADLVICNNSGIAHLAGEQGLPTLAIYSGSHHPKQWGPRGPRVQTVMAELACSPCGHDKLEDCPHEHFCMRLVTPEIIAGYAKTMLPAL